MLNVSVPDYDYDNINRETARLFGEAPLFAPRPDPAVVPTVRASYDEIQRALDELR